MIPTRPIFRKTEFELQLENAHEMVQTCTLVSEHRGEVDCSLRDMGATSNIIRTLQKISFGKEWAETKQCRGLLAVVKDVPTNEVTTLDNTEGRDTHWSKALEKGFVRFEDSSNRRSNLYDTHASKPLVRILSMFSHMVLRWDGKCCDRHLNRFGTRRFYLRRVLTRAVADEGQLQTPFP